MRPTPSNPWAPLALAAVIGLSACGGSDGKLPQLAAANPGALSDCATLSGKLSLANTTISSVAEVAAGHDNALGPFFGIDPQARLDYGYQAAAKLTPMAKSLIQTAYGRRPDRSYFGGCSNGGRHTLVAASRLAEQYDGFLAGAPGYNLPKAAIANIAGAQAYATLATSSDLETGFTATERALVVNAVLAKCDALDGATDGLAFGILLARHFMKSDILMVKHPLRDNIVGRFFSINAALENPLPDKMIK